MADRTSHADARHLRELVMGARESAGHVLMIHRRMAPADSPHTGVDVVDAMQAVADAYVALNTAETQLRRRLAGYL